MPMTSSADQHSQDQITELETRITFLEDTVDTLNQELATLSADFRVAKEALKMVYAKLENLQSGDGGIRNPADEPPPPHY